MRRARGFKLHSMVCWVFSSLLDWFTTTFQEKSTSPSLGLQILFNLTATSSVTGSFQFDGAERGHHSLRRSGLLRRLKHTDVTIVFDNDVLYAMISRPERL